MGNTCWSSKGSPYSSLETHLIKKSSKTLVISTERTKSLQWIYEVKRLIQKERTMTLL